MSVPAKKAKTPQKNSNQLKIKSIKFQNVS